VRTEKTTQQNTIQAGRRNMYPGDTVMIMTREAVSLDGRRFAKGTEFQPSSFGTDCRYSFAVRRVWIRGELVLFRYSG
jgi:hypothetical protein